jgi:hypothetical protein
MCKSVGLTALVLDRDIQVDARGEEDSGGVVLESAVLR